MKKSAFTAFTLAEVLITLGIIGVVAAITIPALMNNIQDAQYKTAYKKAFSVLTQALQQTANDNDLQYRSTWTDATARDGNFLAIMQRFKVAKYCDGTTIFGDKCWDSSGEGYNSHNFPAYTTSACFVDNSGMSWCNEGEGSAILVDTNGFKKPNQFGKDRFSFFTMTATNNNIYTPGIPLRVVPFDDNNPGICSSGHQCATQNNYYGTSWLYN